MTTNANPATTPAVTPPDDNTSEPDWVLWAIGATGVMLFGGVVVASYKAAKLATPYALAAYAPDALPYYEALQRGDKQVLKDALHRHLMAAAQKHYAAAHAPRRAQGGALPR